MPLLLAPGALIAMALITAAILLLSIYKFSVGALVQAAISLMEKATIHVLGVHFNPFTVLIVALKGLDNAAYAALGGLIDANHAIWAQFVHWNAYVWQETTGAIKDITHDTGKALHFLRQVTIPALLGVALLPIRKQLAWLVTKVESLATATPATVTHIEKVIEAKTTVVKPVTVEKITKVIEAKAVALPQAIANPWPRIRDVGHEAEDAWDGVKRIGRTLTPAGILGLVGAAVLSGLDLGWLRCRGVNRVGRSLCGLSGLIEELALGAISAFIVSDLCTIMTLSLKAAEEAKPALQDIFDLVDGLATCQGIKPNPKLTVAGVRLNPPLSPLTL